MSDEMDQVIETAATGPAKVTVDGVTTEAHDISKLIEADRHLATKRAARRKGLPFRILKVIPPGAT